MRRRPEGIRERRTAPERQRGHDLAADLGHHEATLRRGAALQQRELLERGVVVHVAEAQQDDFVGDLRGLRASREAPRAGGCLLEAVLLLVDHFPPELRMHLLPPPSRVELPNLCYHLTGYVTTESS